MDPSSSNPCPRLNCIMILKYPFFCCYLYLFPPSFFFPISFGLCAPDCEVFFIYWSSLAVHGYLRKRCYKAYEKLCVHGLDLSTGELLNETAWQWQDYFIEAYPNNYSWKSIFKSYFIFPENPLSISCLKWYGCEGRDCREVMKVHSTFGI